MSTIWGTPWEQCYRYFGLPTKAFDSEIACLRLAFFLAHFGMFRASGSLRSLHHADYKNIVSICRKFTDLRDLSAHELAQKIGRVIELRSALSSELSTREISPTDTLLSKIMLATTACVPAYDRFAVRALRNLGVAATMSEKSLKQVYSIKRSELRDHWPKNPINIPEMRSLDISLFNFGQTI